MKKNPQLTSRGKAISLVTNEGELGPDHILIQDGRIQSNFDPTNAPHLSGRPKSNIHMRNNNNRG